ncbi:MAG: sugar phosphate isomerase/epimerase [Candidatus Brocadiae bacterium]|nr:sugar phosphate isomerase/epimerase [Candidatus Brocadiia bacterium]
MHVGLMVWEIGERSFHEQIDWARANGFDAIAFHTAPILALRRGIDPATMAPADLTRLSDAIEPFAEAHIHAPFELFDVSLVSPNERVREGSIELIEQSLLLASRVDAATVTVHAGATGAAISPDERKGLLTESLLALDETAAGLGVTIGLEATEHFDLFERVDFEATGVTIDVGHLSFRDGAAYRPWHTLGGLIRHLGEKIVHVHLHDYDGQHDHLPLGSGRIDFAEIVEALAEVDYAGTLCLELAPSPTLEDGYRRSLERLRALL